MAKITAMEEKRKRTRLTPAKFYAAPRRPPSESMLPIFDKSHTRNAMARFNQTDFKSTDERTKAYRKVISAARKFKIDIEDFKKRRPRKLV